MQHTKAILLVDKKDLYLSFMKIARFTGRMQSSKWQSLSQSQDNNAIVIHTVRYDMGRSPVQSASACVGIRAVESCLTLRE